MKLAVEIEVRAIKTKLSKLKADLYLFKAEGERVRMHIFLLVLLSQHN
jgi:hypothetical protein